MPSSLFIHFVLSTLFPNGADSQQLYLTLCQVFALYMLAATLYRPPIKYYQVGLHDIRKTIICNNTFSYCDMREHLSSITK